MNLLFLGTGAADWDIRTRKNGEFFRRLSSALVNGDLLIDPGPQIFDYCEKNGCPTLLDGVTDIIVTHSHGDHFNADTVRTLQKTAPRRIWCNAYTAKQLEELSDCCTVVDFKTEYTVGGYKITPLRANHSPNARGEESLNYLIERDGKSLFYGLDTAWIPCESWHILKQKKLDCAVLEITIGDVPGDYRIFEHNNIRMAELMLETFRKVGALKPDGVACASHFSRFAHQDHGKLAARLGEFGVIAAYDGYCLEF